MATINNADWEYEKPVEGNSTATAPGSEKVQPVILDGSLAEDNTGNKIGYDTSRIDTSTTASKRQSIVFTETDGSTTKEYEIENPDDLGTTTDVTVWVYDSAWATDDTVQFNLYVGGGDGTDYSVDGTGNNPWEQTGVKAEIVQNLNGNALDSTSNDLDGTWTGESYESGEFADGGGFDGNDDYIDTGNNWPDNFTDITIVAWVNWQGSGSTTNNHRIVSRQYQGGGDDPIWSLRLANGEEQIQLIDNSGTSVSISDSGNYDIRDGSNYLFGASYDDSNPVTELRVDANLAGSDTTQLGDISNFNGTNDGSVSIGALFKDSDSTTNEFWDGMGDAVRIYSDYKSGNWWQAEFDASPKGGPIFFTAQAGSTTATTLSLSEDFTINESRSEQQDLFRNFAETLSLQDTDIKYLIKILPSETLGVNDQSSKKVLKSLDENLGVTAVFDSNFGTLTGTVTLSGSPVQGAQVYAVRKSDLGFLGSDTTDSNGDYSIDTIKDNQEVLVAVDYDDGSTLYGDEKSVNFQDT